MMLLFLQLLLGVLFPSDCGQTREVSLREGQVSSEVSNAVLAGRIAGLRQDMIDLFGLRQYMSGPKPPTTPVEKPWFNQSVPTELMAMPSRDSAPAHAGDTTIPEFQIENPLEARRYIEVSVRSDPLALELPEIAQAEIDGRMRRWEEVHGLRQPVRLDMRAIRAQIEREVREEAPLVASEVEIQKEISYRIDLLKLD